MRPSRHWRPSLIPDSGCEPPRWLLISHGARSLHNLIGLGLDDCRACLYDSTKKWVVVLEDDYGRTLSALVPKDAVCCVGVDVRSSALRLTKPWRTRRAECPWLTLRYQCLPPIGTDDHEIGWACSRCRSCFAADCEQQSQNQNELHLPLAQLDVVTATEPAWRPNQYQSGWLVGCGFEDHALGTVAGPLRDVDGGP